jgi:hypothetical protein
MNNKWPQQPTISGTHVASHKNYARQLLQVSLRIKSDENSDAGKMNRPAITRVCFSLFRMRVRA